MATFQQYVADQVETDRLEAERRNNILRLVSYNNRRVRAGLRPLDIPATLAYPTGWNKPIHRDSLKLEQR
jgi:hypothetical protein